MNTTATIEQQLAGMVREWERLFKALKREIGDEYRASDDPGDDKPGMQVTIGFTPHNWRNDGRSMAWGYQTGDNSFAGAAYHHPHWAVVSLYRRSNSRALAQECAEQIAELCWQ